MPLPPNPTVEFVAPDVRICSEIRFTADSTSEPWWSTLTEGFAYGGFCCNRNCVSHTGDESASGTTGGTYASMGFGVFRPNEDVAVNDVRCPGCCVPFEPVFFVFWKCGVIIEYCLTGGKAETIRKVQQQEQNFLRFGCPSVPLATYMFLRITAEKTEPKRIPSDFTLLPGSDLPSVCLPDLRRYPKPTLGRTHRMEMDPADIRYSQSSCGSRFQCGRELFSIMTSLPKSELSAFSHIPSITVFEREGQWYTQNNRRLWCFKEARLTRVPVLVGKFNDWQQFTTVNEGTAINVRSLSTSFRP